VLIYIVFLIAFLLLKQLFKYGWNWLMYHVTELTNKIDDQPRSVISSDQPITGSHSDESSEHHYDLKGVRPHHRFHTALENMKKNRYIEIKLSRISTLEVNVR
jgi:hypothetical protein